MIEWASTQGNEEDTSVKKSWEEQFWGMDSACLHKLIVAADYLEIVDLLKCCASCVAKNIRGKCVSQIREFFCVCANVEDDDVFSVSG